MKFTRYFESMRERPDRRSIRDEWIATVVMNHEREVTQQDGRIRRWGKMDEFVGKYLRVILLADGETVHNAFFDRDYEP